MRHLIQMIFPVCFVSKCFSHWYVSFVKLSNKIISNHRMEKTGLSVNPLVISKSKYILINESQWKKKSCFSLILVFFRFFVMSLFPDRKQSNGCCRMDRLYKFIANISDANILGTTASSTCATNGCVIRLRHRQHGSSLEFPYSNRWVLWRTKYAHIGRGTNVVVSFESF